MAVAEQLIFTSCRYAFGGGSGFQVKSRSPGLSDVDLNTIIQRSDFQRPLHAGGAQADDRAHCPIAIRWYALPSGGWALTRMVYVGTDHTGRPGNFLAHTLAFAVAEISSIDPIDWMDWDGWLDALPPGSDESPAVPALDPVQWTPPRSTEPRLPSGANSAALASALAGVFEAAAEGRPLVLRSVSHQNLDWFRLLARSLPRGHVCTTEFSTFEFNLRRVPTLAMTVDGTPIDVRTGRQNGFVGIDLSDPSGTSPNDSTANSAGRTYGATVARIVFHRNDLWPRFRELLSKLSLKPDADLAAMSQVFMLAEAGEEPEAAPLDLLRFVFNLRSDPSYGALIPNLMSRLPAQVLPATFQDHCLLTDAWAFVCARDNRAENCQRAAAALLHLLFAALPRWPADEDAFDRVRELLLRTCAPDFDELMLHALRRHPDAARAAMVAASVPGAIELLRVATGLVGDAPRKPEVESLVHALMADGRGAAERLQAIVVATPAAEDRAALFDMAISAPGGQAGDREALLGQVLFRSCARLTAREAAKIRSRVPVSILLTEWSSALAGADPVAAHATLATAYDDKTVCLRLGTEEWSRVRLAAARAFVRVGAAGALFEIVDDLEGNSMLVVQPKEDRLRWMALLNDWLRVGSMTDDARVCAGLLAQEKSRLNAVLRPDRSAMVLRLDALSPGRTLPDADLAALADHNGLTEAERIHLSTRLLTFAFRELSSQRDGGLHEALMTGPLRSAGHDVAAYRAALKELERMSDASAVVALLSWWFFAPQAASCGSLWSAVFHDLAATAARIDDAAVALPIGRKFANAASRDRTQRVEQWLRAYEQGGDTGLLRTAGRRFSDLIQGFGKKKT